MFKVGELVQLVCMAGFDTNHTDTPVRSIFNWFHHGNQTILPNDRIHISSNPLQSVIIFAPLLMKDKGTTQCVVSLEPAGAHNQSDFILLGEDGTASLTLGVKGDLTKFKKNIISSSHYHKFLPSTTKIL